MDYLRQLCTEQYLLRNVLHRFPICDNNTNTDTKAVMEQPVIGNTLKAWRAFASLRDPFLGKQRVLNRPGSTDSLLLNNAEDNLLVLQ